MAEDDTNNTNLRLQAEFALPLSQLQMCFSTLILSPEYGQQPQEGKRLSLMIMEGAQEQWTRTDLELVNTGEQGVGHKSQDQTKDEREADEKLGREGENAPRHAITLVKEAEALTEKRNN
ncbi:hypothetical protein WAI453_006314 [Rhynchosporium graminicola]